MLCMLFLLMLSACALSFKSEILACRVDICSRISFVERFDITDDERAKAVVGLLVMTEISSLETDARVLMPRPRGVEDSGEVLVVLGALSSSLSICKGELKLRMLAGENPPARVDGGECSCCGDSCLRPYSRALADLTSWIMERRFNPEVPVVVSLPPLACTTEFVLLTRWRGLAFRWLAPAREIERYSPPAG
jgi:hypothetical protein